ncbi:phage tail spike protein [Paraclostridium bifermentans]|uniref:phage tail spike protein n=1 Tax=Paraclostridium bifermentans TaxID=1490 RepID=UPI0029096213|nr:phage tail spike protein [Paraclostridium bifermentans]MDU3337962.1 phage tail spike protein [Paraclostridium bifermentans]
MLYIFNKDEVLLEIIDDFYDDEYKRVLNKDYTYKFFTDIKNSTNLIRKNKVGFRDENDVFQLFTIEEVERSYSDSNEVNVFCQHDYYSLNDKIIEDKRIVDGTCKEAVTKALEGTKYKVGIVDEFHIGTLNYYLLSSLKAINEIINTYGGELDFRFELNEDNTAISNRYVDIKHRLGEDTGIRFTYDTNVEEVVKSEIMDNHFTVLYGRGKSLETENGGNTRLITFEDVEWSIPNNPANKPLGNKYIEDLDAIAKWGRIEGIYENKDIENTEELLQATWDKLQSTKEPMASYKVLVNDLSGVIRYEHLKTNLGDSIIIVDEEYDINVESRIVEERYSIRDIKATKEIILGHVLPSITDNLGSVIGGNSTGGGDHDKPSIDNSNFPNTLPEIPVVSTKGRFSTIEISWTYENKIYYNYEVYASQLENFNPTPDNMIFKGQASVFLHEVKPKQTWYYRVRACNTHGKFTELSTQVSESTQKISDGAEYFENAAINSALIGSLNADVIDSGTVKGTYIDARNLSVTDGNGNKTLDIDSYGNVKINAKDIMMKSSSLEEMLVDAKYSETNEINKEFKDFILATNNFKSAIDEAFEDGIISRQKNKLDLESNINDYELKIRELENKINHIENIENIIDRYNTEYSKEQLTNMFLGYLSLEGLVSSIDQLKDNDFTYNNLLSFYKSKV